VIYGNVPNNGLISNLPHGACVEVPCLVDGNGVQPTAVGNLPPQLAALNRTYLNVCELAVRAALEGNREHVIHAALLDPNTSATLTPDQTVQMVDALIEAHGPALPEGIR
jgi:alpha-galactosidase